MSSFDTDFATKPGDPTPFLGFWATDISNLKLGGCFFGNHIGARGSVVSSAGGNFGVVGSVGYGDGLPYDDPQPFPAGVGPVGVWGACNTGPGVAGTSSNDAGVVGLSGDVHVFSPPAGVVGSSQFNSGVNGASQYGAGVSGVSSLGNGVTGGSDTGFGIYGHSNKSMAVVEISGEGFAFSGGPTTGVLGISNQPGPQFADAPAGVVGTSDQNQGVLGTSSSSSGVVGISGAPPTTNYAGAIGGVVGASNASAGVYGVSGTYIGVFGTSNSVGVGGKSGRGAGVYGASDSSIGVHADSNSSYGVYASSQSSIGVVGFSADYGPSVPNTIDPVAGVMGTSAEHIGGLGTSTKEAGVAGYSKGAVGVYGETGVAGGNAGFFRGNLLIMGTKSAAVPFPDGTHRALYCMESPELWFEDFGTAKLKRGRAVVKLDADFAKTIRTSDYRVFLTPEGDCGGLYIKSKRGDGFEVRELQGGTSNVAFSYRIVGRRRDIKRHQRFAKIDITPPMQITKSRTVGQPAARAQAVARKLRAAMEKHVAAVATKPARGRKGRSRRQRKARA